jgi:carboxymethylenebutenolidase
MATCDPVAPSWHRAGTRYGLDIFPNSRHGFQFPERDVYETRAAEESWSKIVAMWGRNLK